MNVLFGMAAFYAVHLGERVQAGGGKLGSLRKPGLPILYVPAVLPVHDSFDKTV